MNAPMNTELAEMIVKISKTLMPNESIQSMIKTIKKVDVLRYYRESKSAFLNFGSLLISQTDGWFYIFNMKDELVGIDRIQF